MQQIVLRPQPPAAAAAPQPAAEPAAAPVEIPDTTALERDVQSLAETVAATESEIAEMQGQTARLTTAALVAADSRLGLATAVAAAKAGIEQRRREGDAARVRAAEASARRGRIEAEIEAVDREAAALAAAPVAARQVLAYPTPIGRTVTGEEIHFRLAAGRIAYVPLEELFDLARHHTQRHSGSINELQDRVETVGPAQGFKLDYVIEAKVDQARGQVLIRSREWVARPTGEFPGETAEEALQPTSRFRRVLTGVKPETTVTLWCYPDSFAAYRAIREELHRLGIPTAGRPMPEGAPIGGSTDGSKSVVQ